MKWFVFQESCLDSVALAGYVDRYVGIPIHATVVKGGGMWLDSHISVFLMEGLSNSVRLWSAKNMPSNAYFIFTNPMYPYEKSDLSKQIEFFMDVTNGVYPVDRLVHLANTYEDLETSLALGLEHSIFCNQNAWVDFNQFKITRLGGHRQFQMALNCRPEHFKRAYLAKRVDDLVCIKGMNYVKENYYDLSLLSPKYMNDDRISSVDVNNLLNHAMVGGIFSAAEGACFASSEYLLAGLPVVSTSSIGGRDYWYNENNSIICDANEESVMESTSLAIEMLKQGRFNREDIRNSHMSESIRLRENFIVMLQKLFDVNNSSVDARQIVYSYYNSGGFFKSLKYPDFS